MISTAHVEEILLHFQVELSNFEIVNIEDKKGWSSVFLFLIVEKDKQFVLKGKSKEQLLGFISDIQISNFLKIKGFKVRESIKTREGEYHFLQGEIYWELKSYIPGSVVDFTEYTEESFTSLAQVNTSYINASLNDTKILELGLDERNLLDISSVVSDINKHMSVLTGIIGDEPREFIKWFSFAQKELSSILVKNTDFCIIHNDLNNKNILLDLHPTKVTSFIDWDHGCISTPLKDIVEPINSFYDYVPERYEVMRTIYLAEVALYYQIKISPAELNLFQTYIYALNKWKYIEFFAQLIKDVGNTSNELVEFEDVIRNQLKKLYSMGSIYSVF